MGNKKVEDSVLVEAYGRLSSVWGVADEVGMCGQSVHERLVKLNVVNKKEIEKWKRDAIEDLYRIGFKRGDGNLDNLCDLIGIDKPNVSRYARKLGLTNSRRDICGLQKKAMGERTKRWIKERGHPKGSLGLKHGEETRRKISIASKRSAARKTPEQKSDISLKAMKTKVKNGSANNPRHKTTWEQGWREFGGKRNYYRSRWEANYGRYLQWLLDRGEISSWEHEPKTFWFEGIMRGTRSYLPDFHVVEKNGDEAYHEVKGWMDKKSKTKIKRMAKYHPDVVLVVVAAKEYKDITKSVSALIEGWEE